MKHKLWEDHTHKQQKNDELKGKFNVKRQNPVRNAVKLQLCSVRRRLKTKAKYCHCVLSAQSDNCLAGLSDAFIQKIQYFGLRVNRRRI